MDELSQKELSQRWHNAWIYRFVKSTGQISVPIRWIEGYCRIGTMITLVLKLKVCSLVTHIRNRRTFRANYSPSEIKKVGAQKNCIALHVSHCNQTIAFWSMSVAIQLLTLATHLLTKGPLTLNISLHHSWTGKIALGIANEKGATTRRKLRICYSWLVPHAR